MSLPDSFTTGKSVTGMLYNSTSLHEGRHKIETCNPFPLQMPLHSISPVFPLCGFITLAFLYRGHHPVAHVRPFVVVEIDYVPDCRPCILQVFRPFHTIEPFLLYNAVYALGNGVVRRLVVLRH